MEIISSLAIFEIKGMFFLRLSFFNVNCAKCHVLVKLLVLVFLLM